MPRKGTRKPNRLLKDMRVAYDHPEHVKGESGGLKACRDWLERNAERFLERLSRLEEAQKARSVAGATEARAAKVVDEGTEKAMAVVNRLLDDFDKEYPAG